MTHSKIGSRIIGTRTFCRLVGCTDRQLRDAERDGDVRQISDAEWFQSVYKRMELEAAAQYHAGRREPFTDAEIVALWNSTVAKMEAEEEELFTANVSGAELAESLNVTDRWIRQMAADGHLPRNEDGTYPFAHALACYFNSRNSRR